MDNDGTGSGNARRRSARNKSDSFQYRVRLAEGMIHNRIHEGSCFLLETFRPVPREYRENCEENPEAEVAMNAPTDHRRKAECYRRLLQYVSARIFRGILPA